MTDIEMEKGFDSLESNVVLIDTDSCYFSLDKLYKKCDTKDLSFMEWSQNIDDKFFKPFYKKITDIFFERYNCDNVLYFNREKIMEKMLVLAKKKYIMSTLDSEGEIYEKPKLSFKGVEIVRTDTPIFARKYLLNVIEKIFETENKENTLEFLRDIKKKFKQADLRDISIQKGINNYDKYGKSNEYYAKNGLSYPKGCPIHVRAGINANYMNHKYNLGMIPIASGTKIKFIHVHDNNMLHQNVIGFVGEYPEIYKKYFKIDYDQMWQRNIEKIGNRLFDALHWGEINFNSIKFSKFMTF